MRCHYCDTSVNEESMVSKFMCKYCNTYRKTSGIRSEPIIPIKYDNPSPTRKDYFRIKGLMCEDFIFHKLNTPELSEKYDVSTNFVSEVISAYLNTSKPINVTFSLEDKEEEVVKPKFEYNFKEGDYVRVTKVGSDYHGRIKQIHSIKENGKIKLRNSGNTIYNASQLEKYELKEKSNFNI